MKIVLWASHEAGYRALRRLFAAGHTLLVFTEVSPPYVPSITELAKALNLSVSAGTTDDLMRDMIGEFQPDLGISMYYPRIIKQDILAIPRLGAFNFHPSLLPRHRGCFSAPWAILEGDTESGVTCHEMVTQADRGRILCQSRIQITGDDTAFSLYYRLVDSALTLLDDAMIRLEQEPIHLDSQVGDGCYHRRAVPYDGQINPDWPKDKIDKFIRAMYFPPHPPALLQVKESICPVHSMDEYRHLLK
jgi:methionyl-tRNA formyltransferase